ncbi:MAG TPA: hypothetical protein VFW46_15640, partial [Stellaceae bacterium]|nr:hypothetical protein [Stellaceae bacterium]
GFHAISGHPLEVLRYYAPAKSRYAEVRQSGAPARHHGEDSKIASARITIGAEIHLHELAQRAVKWVCDRAKWKDGPVAKNVNEGTTASGYCGAATASGDCGAATASGNCSAATASGFNGEARGAKGCALFLVNRDRNSGAIRHAWAGIVGQDEIKPDTFYRLGDDGKPVECE